MPASRRRDPFRPPLHEEKPVELAEAPSRPAPAVDLPPPRPPSTVKARQPVKYRRPGVSWVTVLVLGFAAVGVAAVGGGLFKKMTGMAVAPPRALPPSPTIYKALPQDDAVLINVAVSPVQAQLMLDGEPVTSNPLRVPRGPKPHTLAAAADGYAPAVEEFIADKAKTIRLRLTRKKR
jgi:hypothetical protein